MEYHGSVPRGMALSAASVIISLAPFAKRNAAPKSCDSEGGIVPTLFGVAGLLVLLMLASVPRLLSGLGVLFTLMSLFAFVPLVSLVGLALGNELMTAVASGSSRRGRRRRRDAADRENQSQRQDQRA